MESEIVQAIEKAKAMEKMVIGGIVGAVSLTSLAVAFCVQAGPDFGRGWNLSANGVDEKIEIYSDGQLVRDYRAVDGTITRYSESEKTSFVDRETGKGVDIRGQTIVTYDFYQSPAP